MKCARCGSNVDDKWVFCPKCGNELKRKRNIFDIFSHFNREFEAMDKQIKQMDKRFERSFEAMDLSPFFRQAPKGRGFKIKITRQNNEQPKVSVETFGGVKKEDVEQQLKRQLGGGQPIRIRITPVRPGQQTARPQPSPVQRPASQKELPIPKTTEEPKTEVRRVDSKVMVDMELPGVKSIEDIRINDMPESVEVRAVAGDKGFFKILTKPGQFRVSSKSFSKGKLHLEFA